MFLVIVKLLPPMNVYSFFEYKYINNSIIKAIIKYSIIYYLYRIFFKKKNLSKYLYIFNFFQYKCIFIYNNGKHKI